MSDRFDVLGAPTPDAFEAAAQLVRRAAATRPSPQGSPVRPSAGLRVALVMAALVGVAAVPVGTVDRVGTELSWQVDGRPGAAHPSVRLALALAATWTTGPVQAVEQGGHTTYRLAVTGAPAEAPAAWGARLARAPGVRDVHATPLAVRRRPPLALAAAWRLGVPIALGPEAGSPDALQEALTAQFRLAGLTDLTATVTDGASGRVLTLSTERQGPILRLPGRPGLTIRVEAAPDGRVARLMLDGPPLRPGDVSPVGPATAPVRPAEWVRRLRAEGRDSAAALVERALAGLDTSAVYVRPVPLPSP